MLLTSGPQGNPGLLHIGNTKSTYGTGGTDGNPGGCWKVASGSPVAEVAVFSGMFEYT